MKKQKILYIVIGIVGIFAVLGVVFALNSDQILRAVGVSKPAPVFTFNESKALGWWAAENHNSQATVDENYKGDEPIDKLPIAGINVFKGKKGEYKTDCFVMFSYYDYEADVAQLKKDKDQEAAASTSMKKVGEDATSITTFGETKEVILTNYELIGPGTENSMKGMSYGWIDAGNGYVAVSGVCPTSAELDGTLSAVGAMSLVKQ